MPFEHQRRVRFQDTDRAEQLFERLVAVHEDVGEEDDSGRVGVLEAIIASREQVLPLAHAEADFKKPFRVGVLVTTRVTVAEIGDRSVRFQYDMADEKGETLARVTTVHVAVDPASGRSMPLSPRLREALAKHQLAR